MFSWKELFINGKIWIDYTRKTNKKYEIYNTPCILPKAYNDH